MKLAIICFEESQVDFPNKCVLQSLNIAFIIHVANSADHDEMQQTTNLPFQWFPVYKGFYSPLSDKFNQEMPQGPKNMKKSSYLKPLGLQP